MGYRISTFHRAVGETAFHRFSNFSAHWNPCSNRVAHIVPITLKTQSPIRVYSEDVYWRDELHSISMSVY